MSPSASSNVASSARMRPRLPGEQARDHLGATGLDAADRVRRFELDADRAPEVGVQRVAAVSRSVEARLR